MIFLVKRLALGFTLILLASGILLATDLQRRTETGSRIPRVALLQHTSVTILDEGTKGVIDALAERGYRDNDSLLLTRYNAQGDMGSANNIARQMVNDPNDLLVTISTLSLQTVANANKDRHRNHVFGLVADPFIALDGLDRSNPMQHPPYLVGQGIFLPVEDSFRLAQQMHPGLKNVGVVWNPSESNSRVYVIKAREICAALGINLLEATTDNSAGVLEATNAVIARGAQAIWVGGDVSVSEAIDSVVTAARKARIPVFSITPARPDRGTLFDVGVNFYEAGKLTGELAADILSGTDPKSVPIRDVLDVVPRRLVVNRLVLNDLKENWRIPDDVVRRANIVVDEQGIREQPKR